MSHPGLLWQAVLRITQPSDSPRRIGSGKGRKDCDGITAPSLGTNVSQTRKGCVGICLTPARQEEMGNESGLAIQLGRTGAQLFQYFPNLVGGKMPDECEKRFIAVQRIAHGKDLAERLGRFQFGLVRTPTTVLGFQISRIQAPTSPGISFPPLGPLGGNACISIAASPLRKLPGINAQRYHESENRHQKNPVHDFISSLSFHRNSWMPRVSGGIPSWLSHPPC